MGVNVVSHVAKFINYPLAKRSVPIGPKLVSRYNDMTVTDCCLHCLGFVEATMAGEK